MWLPCTPSQPPRDRVVRSGPANVIGPGSVVPRGGSPPSAARQVSLLPLPDPPTSPTISPGRMPSETPRIAVAAPWCTLIYRSSRLSRSVVPVAGLRPGAARSGDLRLSIVIGRLQSRVGLEDLVRLGG